MGDCHSIRLRGPWGFVPVYRELENGQRSRDDLPPAGRIVVPQDWGPAVGTDFFGRVDFRRRFGRPTGLGGAARVWLVCDGADAWATVTLNGSPLGRVEGPRQKAQFDVTDRLLERNELAIAVERPRSASKGRTTDGLPAFGPGGLTGEVRLEITSGPPSAGERCQAEI